MVRIVFSDMDDTLLATDKTLGAENLAMLERLAHEGIPFVPCSGRALRALPKAVIEHPASRYAVCADGATVYERTGEPLDDWELIHHVRLGVPRALKLIDAFEGRRISIHVFANDTVYVDQRSYDLIDQLPITSYFKRQLRETRTIVPGDLKSFVRTLPDVDRLNCLYIDASDGQLIRKLVDEDRTLGITTSETHHYHLLDASASKGNALVWLCGYLGIPVADSIFFGDAGNDVSAILAAGTGVAVGNAEPAARAVADAVTCSNDESGFACYLEEVLAHQSS